MYHIIILYANNISMRLWFKININPVLFSFQMITHSSSKTLTFPFFAMMEDLIDSYVSII